MNLALFDFDGTISYSDTFSPFIHLATPFKTKLTQGIFILPFLLGYKLNLISATYVRQKAIKLLRGLSKNKIALLGEAYAKHILPSTIRPHALERLLWHVAQGDKVVVVSASLDIYLKHWCNQYTCELICNSLEVNNSFITGNYNNCDCAGAEKAKRIIATYTLHHYDTIFAYGDTVEDMDMLNLAHVKYFQWQQMVS